MKTVEPPTLPATFTLNEVKPNKVVWNKDYSSCRICYPRSWIGLNIVGDYYWSSWLEVSKTEPCSRTAMITLPDNFEWTFIS